MTLIIPAKKQEPKEHVSGPSEYNDLKFYFGYLNTLFTIRDVLVVDMVTSMPSGGLRNRMNDISSLTKRIYTETTSDSITQLLSVVENDSIKQPENWTSWNLANLQEMKRLCSSLKAVPPSLYINLVRIQNGGRQLHREVIAKNKSWDDVKPHIEQVVNLHRQAADKKQETFKTDTLYDALLYSYAPNLNESYIDALYENALPELKNLSQDKLKQQEATNSAPPEQHSYSTKDLMAFNHKVLEKMGFNFSRGTLSISNISPMSVGSHDDARVLIRCINDTPFIQSLEDTLYQGAHGLYLQSLPQEWHNQPVGKAQGTIVTTAISLLYKIILGRRHEFFNFIGNVAEETLTGFASHNYDAEQFYKLKHTIRVTPKRNDADAMSKIFHDIMRYRIERDLINGTLDTADIPERWNAESQELIGVVPQSLSEGALQNPDWFTGRFGFISTNTISYIIAAQLYKKIKRDIPSVLGDLSKGDLSGIHTWLTDNIFKHGCSIDTLDLIKESTNSDLNEAPLLEMFKDHYLDGQ